MKSVCAVLIMLLLVGLGCNTPEDDSPINMNGREEFRHCIPLHQYVTIEFDTTGTPTLVYYVVLQDTLKNEFLEQRIRSFKPDRQVFILGYVELSDFSKAGRGIYYSDPIKGPRLLDYETARIVKRLRRGDSPWTIAGDLDNPDLVDAIEWGRLLPGSDFMVDLDLLEAVRHWGGSFDLPGTDYSLVGTEVPKVFVKGTDESEEGQRPTEIFIRQEVALREEGPGAGEIAFYNVFKDTAKGIERVHPLRSIKPEYQVYVLGHEKILPDLRAMATGLYYDDPDSGGMLLDYFGARITKRVVPGDSYWKTAKNLGNAGVAKTMGQGIIHPGDTLTVEADILEAVGWDRQYFNLPDDTYRIIGRRVSKLILKTGE